MEVKIDQDKLEKRLVEAMREAMGIETENAVRMVWRWDDIFRVYRCPYCGRPEKPCFELWKKGGLKKSLPSRCTYCEGELEGVEGEEDDH